MKLKRLMATLLAAVMLTTTALASTPAPRAAEGDNPDQYVLLDGEWSFKLYRTYSQMYQYMPYNMVKTTWEDLEAAVYPANDAWKNWDTVSLPVDDFETGGLLDNDTCPSWSESWVVREFDLPEDFTNDETVTLLMGIVDDNDVVYINGTPVASSGFIDGNKAPLLDVPATGGFDYKAEAPEDQVKWEKSYWEIQREYTIPAEVLNQGGTNEIAIRVYNNNGFGGFYSGHVYALCGNDLAVRNLKGLPTIPAESPEVEAAVADQLAALDAGSVSAYAATIAKNYHNDDQDKDALVDAFAALVEKGVTAEDANAAIYLDDDGFFWYSAERTYSNGTTEDVALCFDVEDGVALERGNWNRCYGTSYASELFGQDLTYSVYLPPSYYENTEEYYPTVWLLHGRASSSTSYRDVDKIGAFMDGLIESGDIMEMVLIMPDSGKYAFYQDSELQNGDKDNTGPWRTQLTDELRKVAEEEYRLIANAAFRGLSGNSMGGNGSLTVGTGYPGLYSSIAIHMPQVTQEGLNNLMALSMYQLSKYDFYIDAGLQDATVGYKGAQAVADYLESVGADNYTFVLRDGGHNSAFYMAGMVHSMKMHSDHFAESAQFDVPTYSPDQEVVKAPAFADVADSAYYAEAVQWAVSNDVTSGTSDTTFSPDAQCTRAQVVTFLYNLAGAPSVTLADAFADVDADDWFAKSVSWASKNNVVSGMGDDTFAPNAPITREQLAVILFNYAKSKGYDVSVGENTNILSYNDAFSISEWAMSAMQWACGAGVMSGTPEGNLLPGGVATRAHVVQMLMNFSSNVK